MTLSSPWQLYRGALRDYKAQRRVLAGIVLLVSVPVALISAYLIDASADTSTSAYITFAQLAMNVALMYAIVRTKHGKAVSVGRAYYDGSIGLIRIMLVSVLLVLMLLPLLLALIIVSTGLVSPGTQLALPEQLLLGLLAVVAAIPSLLLLARSIWSLYIIFETPKGPIQAISASWRISRKQTWASMARLICIIIFVALTLLVPAALLVGLQSILPWRIFTALLQIVASLIVLPLSNLYLYQFYREMYGQIKST